MLFTLAARLLCNEDDAKDVVQETFIKLWSMRDDLQENDSAVSGLVFTIARNLRKNHYRNNQRITFVDEIKDGDLGGTPEKTLPSDLDYLRKRLTAAFAELPPPLREAYTLFQVAELSIREIADTGLSAAIHSSAAHAKRQTRMRFTIAVFMARQTSC